MDTTLLSDISDITATSELNSDNCVLGYIASLVYIMDGRAKVVLFSESLNFNKKSLLVSLCEDDLITTIEVPDKEEVLGYSIKDLRVLTIITS